MSRPINNQQHDGAQGTGPGEAVRLKGHNSLGFFVDAQNVDTANDTLRVVLEVSPDGDKWGEIKDHNKQATSEITTSNIGDGQVAVQIHGCPFEMARIRIADFNDASGDGDLSVNTWLFAGNNAAGTGHSGNPH